MKCVWQLIEKQKYGDSQLDPKYAHSFSIVVFFPLLSAVNHFKKPKVKPVIDLASFFVGEFCLWSTLERH